MAAKGAGKGYATQETGGCGGLVTVRVIKATLNRSFDTFGKMDPFCKVEWFTRRPGCERHFHEIGRTKSDWGGHKTPKWHHMCKAMTYNGSGGGDHVKFTVSEENFQGMGTPTFCGSAVSTVDDLIANAASTSEGVLTSPTMQLSLSKEGEVTGTLYVQLVYRQPGSVESDSSSRDYNAVDSSLFVTPVKRLGVSGGTAPFFGLKLQSPDTGKSEDYWIGKDLSRATDEIAFYEELKQLSTKGGHGMDQLFDFMFEYAGVLRCAEADVGDDSADLELLVLRNLRDGCRNLRMLDIKIGEKTAAANWQGKSRFAALKQGLIDGLTNSAAQGYRLEGFDGPPPALESMDPLLDGGSTEGFSKGTARKAKRIMMQRMSGAEMFSHFFDLHQVPGDASSGDLNSSLQSVELAEIVAADIVMKLVNLSVACRRAPVPQKWIGSSVALGFDDQTLPSRSTAVSDIVKTVRVYVFDWGRSELNTIEKHGALSADDQADRKEFWEYYTGGMYRLAWEAARYFWHRFCNCSDWNEIVLKVFDFDSFTANDFMGQVRVPLVATSKEESTLKSSSGASISGSGGRAKIVYSIEWHDLPQSRLKGIWRITIHSAANLPVCDGLSGKSDPFVVIKAMSKDSDLSHRQQTSVIAANLNPVWNEMFDLPVSAGVPNDFQHHLSNILKQDCSDGSTSASDLFPDDTATDDVAQTAFENWSKRLKKYAGGTRLSH